MKLRSERLRTLGSADFGRAGIGGTAPARKRKRIEGKDATTSMWRMNSPKGDIILAVTTYPDPTFMIQHLMTASYVK
jgi:hypothetical protein